MRFQAHCRNGSQNKMKKPNSNPQDLLRPEEFPLGSEQSRAAARTMLEGKEEPEIDLAARMQQARFRTLEGTLRKPTPEECAQRANRLRKAARCGDTLAQRLIAADERMVRLEREEEAQAQATDAKE